jgi:anti-sigma factor RsiW
MGSPQCHWVRHRLPLLVGDDLRGPDRRWVERHLIGCPQCRQHQASLCQALQTLQSVAAASPAAADAPSLWPALARQIRESRRPSPTSTFAFPFPFAGSWLRLNPLPALGLGLGLALLATAAASLGVRQQNAAGHAQILAKAQPITPAFDPTTTPLTGTPAPDLHREPPAPVEAPTADTSPTPRFDLDSSLELGRPMPDREVRDTKATY